MKHISVLPEKTIELLQVKPDGIYADGTLGRGGHASMVLERLTEGHLYGFDKDEQAIRESTENLKAYADRFTPIYSDFRNMRSELENRGVYSLDGAMFDLGVSSPQFDDPARGFSYRFDARLDMRMDTSQEKDAYSVVNTYSKQDLIRILRDYGEERYAASIADRIVKKRQESPVETTFQLADIVRESIPARELHKKGHPAKQTFQALRIEVNDELGALEEGLRDILDILNPGGRCAVITFHSLEDRIVKKIFKEYSSAPFVEPRLPLKAAQMEQASFRLVTRKPVTAEEEEIQTNNRSHSAKLRVIEKL
ncbi:MAG: 16S rRNA (cytosine(1402)-N(4))-methyltransferase RsmH [Solobacterium sp.]|nr:16S rRNA (cytosine(1402)-N(4))-methyltransferase RsmH [Solobacterium sp.]